jgi:hypothetical protein
VTGYFASEKSGILPRNILGKEFINFVFAKTNKPNSTFYYANYLINVNTRNVE